MAFNLTGLTAYTAENQFDLMTAAVFGAKMFSNATVIPNVKGPSKLPLLADSVQFATDSCGFTATGDTTITQRTLTPGKVKINREWCPKDLEAYYFRQQIAAGSHKENIEPIEGAVMKYLMSLVAQSIDTAIWQGRITASGGGIGSTVPMGFGNNGFWDGLRFQIQDNTGGYVDANATTFGATPLTTAFTPTNMVEAVMRIYRALGSVNVLDEDVVVYMGVGPYTALVQALFNGGSTFGTLLNQGINGDTNPAGNGLTFAGLGLKILPVVGLNSINAIYGARKSNLFIGVDAESDFTNMEMWWSQDDRKFKMAMEFKVGTQIAYASNIAAIVL